MIWLECSGPSGRLSLRSSRNGRTILCAPQRMPLLPLRFSHAVVADLRRQGHRGFRRVALTQLQYRFNFVPEENRMIKPQLAEFMRRMDKDSVAIIPAAREAVRSHDTNYRYRQNSDFFYLTGFEEPEAIAVIAPAREKKFTMFVRPRDLDQEIWYGYRAGVEGAKQDYNADEAFTIDQFDEKLTEILDGPRVLYYAFGHTDSGIDQKIIQQLTMMRESNRKPFEPPATIVDPSTILHEMRVLKSPEEIEIMQHAADMAAEAH